LTGAALDYDDDWAGRFQVQDVELLGIAISPSIGYRVNDWLSVGLAVPIMYTELEMDVATPNINQLGGPEGKATVDGDDVEIGFRPSVLIEFSPQTRLGAYYQTRLEPSYGGDFTLKGEAADFQVGIDTDLALSEKAYAGFTHEFSDAFSGHLTAGWEGWSDMDNVFLSGEQNGAVLPRNWKDAWKGAVGIDYRLNDQWTLRTGFAYDQNVVSKHDRTADMPVDRQYRYAFGAEYQLAGGPSISGQLVYVDAGEARIEADGLGAGPGIGIADGFGGKYSTNDIYFFSVSASWVLGDNK
jgi:long-chain fatty acid transport protein